MDASSESHPPGNTPRNPVDAFVKRSLARNGIRTLDRPARSSHYAELSLLLRAYLSTELKKKQVATVKLF